MDDNKKESGFNKTVTMRQLIIAFAIFLFCYTIALQFLMIPEINGKVKNIIQNVTGDAEKRIQISIDEVYRNDYRNGVTKDNADLLFGLILNQNKRLLANHLEFERMLDNNTIVVNSTCLPSSAVEKFSYDMNQSGVIQGMSISFIDDSKIGAPEQIAWYQVTEDSVKLSIPKCNITETIKFGG